MNLHDLSDQEFDRTLREHLGGANISYDPVSWDKMSKKLDTVTGTNGRSNGGILGLTLLSLLLAGVFFLGVASFPGSELHQQTKANIQQENTRQQSFSNNETRSGRQSQATQGFSESVKEKVEHASDGQAAKANNDTPQASLVRQQQEISGSRQVNTAESRDADGKITHSRVSPKGISDTMLIQDVPGGVQPLDPFAAQLPPIVQESNRSPWFIGFGYAPDISLVGFGALSSPGTNLGFTLERRLGSRWSIQTGVIYATKKYKAKGEDYHPPEGFWVYGDVPEETDAECDVIDIPINLRYYFKPQARHQFYASTGLSSYLMLTEDYYYHYESYGSPYTVDSYSVRNENRHIFGIYNLSMGYQRNLGKQWYLEIEPFIKVPLSGVGFGEVDLWSTGSMFSLKYNFK